MAEYVDKLCLFGQEAKIRPTIIGDGEPTAETEACVGAFYFDIRSKKVYFCIAQGVWSEFSGELKPIEHYFYIAQETIDAKGYVDGYINGLLNCNLYTPVSKYSFDKTSGEYTTTVWEDGWYLSNKGFGIDGQYLVSGEIYSFDREHNWYLWSGNYYPLNEITGVTVISYGYLTLVNGLSEYGLSEDMTKYVPAKNGYTFSNYSDTDYKYQLKRNGEVIASGYCYELDTVHYPDTDGLNLMVGDVLTVGFI